MKALKPLRGDVVRALKPLGGDVLSPPPKPLAPGSLAALGYAILRQCLITDGETLPPPASVRGVSLANWRRRLEQADVINPRGNPREQFRRIKKALEEGGHVSIADGFVWLNWG